MRILSLLVLMLFMIVTGCSTSDKPVNKDGDWQISPRFKVKVKDNNGSSIVREIQGEEGRLGIIASMPFVAGKPYKVMWHFWGPPDPQSKMKVVAVNQKGEEHPVLIQDANTVWEYPHIGGPNNGADAHLPSNVKFPSAGLWRLQVYLDGNMFGTIVVEVKS